jgi:hypothetical protein
MTIRGLKLLVLQNVDFFNPCTWVESFEACTLKIIENFTFCRPDSGKLLARIGRREEIVPG